MQLKIINLKKKNRKKRLYRYTRLKYKKKRERRFNYKNNPRENADMSNEKGKYPRLKLMVF